MAQNGVKPWQIALVVLGMVALPVGIWLSTRGNEPRFTHSVTMVDITNGKLYEFSTSDKPVIIPETNPDSGKNTLFPASRDSDGKWKIPTRYLDSLGEVKDKPVNLLDKKTGEVRVENDQAKKVAR